MTDQSLSIESHEVALGLADAAGASVHILTALCLRHSASCFYVGAQDAVGEDLLSE